MRVNSSKYDTYSYDPTDAVTGVKYEATATAGTGATRTVSYAYDSVGNRQNMNVVGTGSSLLPVTAAGSTNYAPASATNQYFTAGPQNFGYDGNGNLSSKTGSTAWTYTYDAQNRLITAQSTTNSVSFTYDTRNRQVSRTVNGVTTYFVWDAWSLLEERDATGQLTQHYTHGAGTDELIAKTDSLRTVYYHHDGLGSTTALSDTTGTLVETYRYDVCGAVAIYNPVTHLALASSQFSNRFLYTGREWMAEAGLYDYRNRVYSVELGRFLQHDPIRFWAGDINLYRYVGNEPINLLDQDGLAPQGGGGRHESGVGTTDGDTTADEKKRGERNKQKRGNQTSPTPKPAPEPEKPNPLHPQDVNGEQHGEITPPKDWCPAPNPRKLPLQQSQKQLEQVAEGGVVLAILAAIGGFLFATP